MVKGKIKGKAKRQIKYFDDNKNEVPFKDATMAVELVLDKDGLVVSSRHIIIDRGQDI